MAKAPRTTKALVQVEGLNELLQMFSSLDDASKGHTFLKVAEAGAAVLEPVMFAMAPRGTGDDPGELARSIVTKSRIVNPRRARADVGPTVYYAPHVELGHDIVSPAGKVTGRAAPRPFMRQSFRATRERIVEAMATEFLERITRVTGGSVNG